MAGILGMDDEVRHAWIEFMQGPGGKDLLGRFVSNEQMFIAAAMKKETAEQKGLEMAKMEAIYRFREGILDIIKPKPSKSAQSQSSHSAGSK